MMVSVRGIVLAAGLAGCTGLGEPNLDLGDLPATVTLEVGQRAIVSGTAVVFSAVTADSRCPIDVVCVWAGNAELEFVVGPTVGLGPAQLVKLNTYLEPRSAAAQGLTLSVDDLHPAPRSDRQTKGYRVQLRIERTPVEGSR